MRTAVVAQVKQVAESARPNLLKLDGVLSVFAALKLKSGVPLDCFAVSVCVREKKTQVPNGVKSFPSSDRGGVGFPRRANPATWCTALCCGVYCLCI